MTMLPKKQMSEEDIKLQFITPAITAKWDISKITMETTMALGYINILLQCGRLEEWQGRRITLQNEGTI